MTQYVLCLPRRCGFNDVLTLIWDSYSYAKKCNRHLIVDTRLSGLHDSLSSYFTLRNEFNGVDLELSLEQFRDFNEMSCYPNEYQGKLPQLYHYCSTSVRNKVTNALVGKWITAGNLVRYGIRPTLDQIPFSRADFVKTIAYGYFKKSHPRSLAEQSEQLVIHHRSGGGDIAILALSMLQLRREVREHIGTKLALCGPDYDALHIRHTDYQTNYVPFVKEIKPKLKNRTLLLCSDNSDVIDTVRILLDQTQVVVLSDILAEKRIKPGDPLHRNGSTDRAFIRRRNLDMLTDLMAMSNARQLYFTQIVNTRWNHSYSGFSRLAKQLHERPKVWNALMDTKADGLLVNMSVPI
jgi:hypothetical protein